MTSIKMRPLTPAGTSSSHEGLPPGSADAASGRDRTPEVGPAGHGARPTDESEQSSAPPRAFARLESRLGAANTRPVNRATAGQLALRHPIEMGPGKGFQRLSARHSAISDEDRRGWALATGRTPEDVAASQKWNFISGMVEVTPSVVSNALVYIVPAVIAYANETTRLAGGQASPIPPKRDLSPLVANVALAILAPLVNALVQPAMVTIGDHIRGRNGFTVPKSAVKDENWRPPAARAFGEAAKHWSDTGREVAGLIEGLADAKGLAGRMPDADWARALLDGLPRATRDSLRDGLRAYREAVLAPLLGGLELDHAEAALERSTRQHARQAWPRAARPLTGLANLLVSGKDDPVELAKAAKLSVAIQCSGQAIFGLLQVGAGGWDRMRKEQYHDDLNMMLADYLDDHGRDGPRAGERTDEAGAALRRLTISPDQKMVADVIDIVDNRIARLRHGAALSDPTGRGQGTPLDRLQADVRVLRAARDAAEPDLSGLDREGLAFRLLEGAERWGGLGILSAKVLDAYRKPGELPQQIIQRYSQAFHFLLFGAAAASILTRAVTTGMGGAEAVPKEVIGGLVAAAVVMASIGAMTQGVSVAAKNNERAKGDAGSRVAQAKHGLFAGYELASGALLSRAGLRQAQAADLRHIDMIAYEQHLGPLLGLDQDSDGPVERLVTSISSVLPSDGDGEASA